jgi:hypothetical protein
MSDETTSSNLDAAVELPHRAGGAIMKGSHEGYVDQDAVWRGRNG